MSMNREIKFRAWIKERIWNENVPNMFKREDGYPKMVDVVCVYSGDYFEYREGLCYLKVTRQTYDFELMQWTGLCDRNGTEIYEGDILKIPYTYYDLIDFAIKVPYDEYILGVVAFSQKSGAFGIILPEDEDELSQGFNSFDFAFENIGYECEIIGNRFVDRELLLDIFENLELLEGE